jgi:MFS family permease
MVEVTESETRLRWYQGLARYQWLVLIIAALGWLFDTMDQNIFTIMRQPAVSELVRPLVPAGDAAALQSATNYYGGIIVSVFLIGWALGGALFGVLGDRIGRTRTMVLTILIYALCTGLSGLAQTWQQLAAFRFLAALGVGGEWAAGASIVAEVFPQRSRAMALGTLQALSAVGNMTAAVICFGLASVSWRWAFAVGILPALVVVWIRRSLKEPERWQHAKEVAATDVRKELGAISHLFTDPVLRRNTIGAVLLATAGVGGLWGVGFWTPDLLTITLKPLGVEPAQMGRYRSEMFFVQQAGALFGMYAYALFSERTSRRGALLVFFVLSWAAVEGMFWTVHTFAEAMVWAPILGFCTLGPFSAYTVYFPELYPTRLRTTGCGFCYNCARVLAAGAPFILGGLARHFAAAAGQEMGFRIAAAIVACIYVVGLIGLVIAPETKGQPLPE